MTIAENIDKKIIYTNANYKDYLENSIINVLFLKSTKEEKVSSTIKQMKTNKALGFKYEMYVFKKGDSQDYNNHRPISLISDLMKLIKQLAHKRLYSFLEKHFLLFEKQYGFCTKMSTNLALIDMANKI